MVYREALVFVLKRGRVSAVVVELRESVVDKLRESVVDKLRELVVDELRELVVDELGESVVDELGESVVDDLEESVEDELGTSVLKFSLQVESGAETRLPGKQGLSVLGHASHITHQASHNTPHK